MTSRVEHPAIRALCAHLATRGYRVTELPVDGEGRLDMDQYRRALTPDTAIVSLMWANNETGVIFPIEKAAEMARERGILFHTDAVQSVGKIPIDLAKTPIDMLSLSGHKLHAPKGIGVLYLRKGTKFSPFLIGGHQERGQARGNGGHPEHHRAGGRSGTGGPEDGHREHLRKALRDKLENTILQSVANTKVNGDRVNRLPNTTNISFEFVEGEGILLMMDEFGICASRVQPAPRDRSNLLMYLRAMGVPFTMAHGSIRFSLSIYNTDEEIDFVMEKLPPIIETLRSMSPYWKSGAQLVRMLDGEKTFE